MGRERFCEVTNLPTDLLWGARRRSRRRSSACATGCGLTAFLQTNTEMCEVLYSVAREYAALTGDETVYDLYCGIGTIGPIRWRTR